MGKDHKETGQPKKRYDEMMSRFEDTEAALTERLRAMKAKPEMTINLFDIGVTMTAAGFSEAEIMTVLSALEQDRIISFVAGNRMVVLKDLPQ